MADINKIQNAETGLSVRGKLNEVIDRINAQGGETLTTDNVEVYSPNKIGGYTQGAIVAYSSETAGFEEPKLYRALVDIPQGQSPEDYPLKWFNEGDQFEVVTSNTSTGVVNSLAELRAIEGMKTGDTVIVYNERYWYRFDETVAFGEVPNVNVDGTWVKKNRFNDSNLVDIVDAAKINDSFFLEKRDDTLMVLRSGTVAVADPTGATIDIEITQPSFIVKVGVGYTVNDYHVKPISGENEIVAFSGTGALADPQFTTDNVNDTITVQENDFVVYEDGRFKRVTVPEKTMPLTLESEQFIVVTKIGDNWGYDNTIDVTDIDATHINAIPVITIDYYTLDGVKTIHYIDWNSQALNGVNRAIDIRVKEDRFRRLEGLGITVNSNREVTISASKIAYGLNKLEIDEANSLSHAMWQAVYNGTSWNYTKVTQLNNTQYQGATGLETLSNNEYGVYFIFRGAEIQRHIYVMFGADSYTLEQARLQDFPATWPTLITSHAMPVARVIYEKGSNIAEIQSVYGGILGGRIGSPSGGGTTVHGDLTGRSEANQHPAAAIQDNAERPYLGTTNPTALNNVLAAINSNAEKWNEAYDNRYWEPELLPAATTEHPRWDDSGDAEIYGRDKFNFNALPAGTRTPSGPYASLGEWIDLWVKNADVGAFTHVRLQYNSSLVNTPTPFTPEAGYSVRLVRPYTTADGDKIDGRILQNDFTDFDGNTYDGVIIGDQVWLTSNLKTTSYSNGDPITTGLNDTDWSNATSGAYAVYDYTLVAGIDSEAEMIAAYGLLYNWYAVDDIRGLGDGTYVVPTDSQFTQLTDYIIANYPEIDSSNAGDYLKSVRQVNSPFEVDSYEVIRPKENLSGERRKANLKDIIFDIREESASFTVSEVDGNTQIRYTGATDITLTIPNTLTIGQPITITQAGAGIITLQGDTGVTVNSLLGLKTPGQGGHIQFWKVKDNVIDTVGGVA